MHNTAVSPLLTHWILLYNTLNIDFILRKAANSNDLVMIHVSYKVTSESESRFQIP